MNGHDWGSQSDASYFCFKFSFVFAVVMGHVGGGAPHVKGDNAIETGHFTGLNCPDNASSRPGQDAILPGDIFTAKNGKTIMVDNTDAEGRLILCDSLTYAQKYDPDVVIDVATLTGACIVALGNHPAGLVNHGHDVRGLVSSSRRIAGRTCRF